MFSYALVFSRRLLVVKHFQIVRRARRFRCGVSGKLRNIKYAKNGKCHRPYADFTSRRRETSKKLLIGRVRKNALFARSADRRAAVWRFFTVNCVYKRMHLNGCGRFAPFGPAQLKKLIKKMTGAASTFCISTSVRIYEPTRNKGKSFFPCVI